MTERLTVIENHLQLCLFWIRIDDFTLSDRAERYIVCIFSFMNSTKFIDKYV